MINGALNTELPLLDRAIHYGDGLFETMRLASGRLPCLDLHLSRLAKSAGALSIPCSTAKISVWLENYLRELGKLGILNGSVKLILSRGQGKPGYIPPTAERCQPNIIFFASSFDHVAQRPQTLRLLKNRLSRNPALAGHKHLSKLEYIMSASELSCLDADAQQTNQGLLMDSEDWVIETLHHNLFVVRENRLVTPDLTFCGVHGVLKNLIVERVAETLALDVSDEQLRVEDLEQADEVFLTNSVRGVLPVEKFNHKRWAVWPVTEKLTQAINAIWNETEN